MTGEEFRGYSCNYGTVSIDQAFGFWLEEMGVAEEMWSDGQCLTTKLLEKCDNPLSVACEIPGL